MQTPIETISSNHHAGTQAYSEASALFGQQIASSGSRASEDSLAWQNQLDFDHQHSWVKLQSPLDLIMDPTESNPTSSPPTSICSCESSAEHFAITSAPMIREQVQSYIGWTSTNATFRNDAENLSSLDENVGALSSPITFSRPISSPNLPEYTSHTLDSHTKQAKVYRRNQDPPSRKTSQTFQDCFRNSAHGET